MVQTKLPCTLTLAPAPLLECKLERKVWLAPRGNAQFTWHKKAFQMTQQLQSPDPSVLGHLPLDFEVHWTFITWG